MVRVEGVVWFQGNVDLKTAPWPTISEAAKDCVRKLLTRDPSRRPTAKEILQVSQSLTRAHSIDPCLP